MASSLGFLSQLMPYADKPVPIPAKTTFSFEMPSSFLLEAVCWMLTVSAALPKEKFEPAFISFGSSLA